MLSHAPGVLCAVNTQTSSGTTNAMFVTTLMGQHIFFSLKKKNFPAAENSLKSSRVRCECNPVITWHGECCLLETM